jgi:hypothetical protein
VDVGYTIIQIIMLPESCSRRPAEKKRRSTAAPKIEAIAEPPPSLSRGPERSLGACLANSLYQREIGGEMVSRELTAPQLLHVLPPPVIAAPHFGHPLWDMFDKSFGGPFLAMRSWLA